jgi:hypothetical protein
MIHFIRRVGKDVIEAGQAPDWQALSGLCKKHPGQYFLDDGTTQLSPIKAPKPEKPKRPKRTSKKD